ncbi:hypothetical protein HZZ13_05565 [Bradyrhizobium sp. CNPSo 4010]|uniref:Uncharacterized protein n=1 Tax=Bradyrhizobium agreste TaxID=2751811 RepID=A0ABS0PJ82_9BRAD|nr:hypothetical protein [Bradyrhizobium agreste]MBH5397261.1 hypothetical protein [Bradyrhizobium agreste]
MPVLWTRLGCSKPWKAANGAITWKSGGRLRFLPDQSLNIFQPPLQLGDRHEMAACSALVSLKPILDRLFDDFESGDVAIEGSLLQLPNKGGLHVDKKLFAAIGPVAGA